MRMTESNEVTIFLSLVNDDDQKHEIVKFASAPYRWTLQLISSDMLMTVNI